MPVLIVGSGLSAVCMAAALHERKLPFRVLPLAYPFGGTAASSGILNPLTGRKRLPDAHFHLLYPEALRRYRLLETQLQESFFHPVSIREYAATAAEKAIFSNRSATHPDWMIPAPNSTGVFEIKGAFMLDKSRLIQAFLKKYAAFCLPAVDAFQLEEVRFFADSLAYQNQTYSRLILANGTAATDNKWFQHLPLGRNKGQAWLVKIPNLDRNFIHKKEGITLAPWPGELWWAGASFEWQYNTPESTPEYEQVLRRKLEAFPALPFEMIRPLSGIRPSPADRRAIAGWHPQQKLLGLLNGMGTKGVLQAPYAAQELTESLFTDGKNLVFGLEKRLGF